MIPQRPNQRVGRFDQLPADEAKALLEAINAMEEHEAINPDWSTGGYFYNWKKYISDEVRGMWGTFTTEQKMALYRQSEEIADLEGSG